MKRWIAVILAAILLLTGSIAAADGTGGAIDGETQETTEPQERINVGTLINDLHFLVELAQSEDVRNLFQLQDVKDLMHEGVYYVLVWLAENRPVTMKILVELGVGGSELHCIETVWDSVERIQSAWRSLAETEDGKQLLAELDAVRNDPEIQESTVRFWALVSSDEVARILDLLWNTVIEEEISELAEGALTREALERRIDRTTFTGILLIRLLQFTEESEWAQESVPALLNNENLWQLLIHLAEDEELYQVLGEEVRILSEDPEIKALLQQIAQEITALYQQIVNDPDQLTPIENSEAVHEEADP